MHYFSSYQGSWNFRLDITFSPLPCLHSGKESSTGRLDHYFQLSRYTLCARIYLYLIKFQITQLVHYKYLYLLLSSAGKGSTGKLPSCKDQSGQISSRGKSCLAKLPKWKKAALDWLQWKETDLDWPDDSKNLTIFLIVSISFSRLWKDKSWLAKAEALCSKRRATDNGESEQAVFSRWWLGLVCGPRLLPLPRHPRWLHVHCGHPVPWHWGLFWSQSPNGWNDGIDDTGCGIRNMCVGLSVFPFCSPQPSFFAWKSWYPVAGTEMLLLRYNYISSCHQRSVCQSVGLPASRGCGRTHVCSGAHHYFVGSQHRVYLPQLWTSDGYSLPVTPLSVLHTAWSTQ